MTIIYKLHQNTMAAKIRFMNNKDEEQFTLKNHIIDVCKSYTVIYNRDFFSVYKIFDTPVNYDIDKNRIRVNFSTGFYLLIKPF